MFPDLIVQWPIETICEPQEVNQTILRKGASDFRELLTFRLSRWHVFITTTVTFTHPSKPIMLGWRLIRLMKPYEAQVHMAIANN